MAIEAQHVETYRELFIHRQDVVLGKGEVRRIHVKRFIPARGMTLPTQDELTTVHEANDYFESSPLQPWERSSGEHLQKREKLTQMFEQKAYRLTLYMLEQSEEQAGDVAP